MLLKLSPANLPIFTKSLSALLKISQEIWLACTDILVLISVNQTRSTYCQVECQASLFTEFTNLSIIQIKLLLKPIVLLLRQNANMNHLEMCVITLENDRLTIVLECKYGVRKTHHFVYSDSDAPRAVYNSQDCNQTFTAAPRSLRSLLTSFPPLLHDVTLELAPDSFGITSECKSLEERQLATRVTIDCADFERFQVNCATNLQINLKELKV